MRIIQVDAFTDIPFCGNPAAVCVLPQPREPDWMQKVAREMNLSETAFLVRRTEEAAFDLRWFTPVAEVDLCGHATLASAHALWEENHVQKGSRIRFYTNSGILTAGTDDDWIILDFPAEPPEEITPPAPLTEALRAIPVYTGKNRMDYIAELEDAAVLRNLQPNITLLESLGMRGIIVTARSDDKNFDFISRFFAPRFGVPEDPVTGSAHSCLGPYWMQRLGKSDMVGYQASARGGVIRVKVCGSRVQIGGKAVTVLRAVLVDG